MKFTKLFFSLLCLTALVVVAWAGTLDAVVVLQIESGLKKTLSSFAIFRGIHGALSVLQASDISVKFFGFGGELALGQMLAPVNELVKDVSDIMLIAAISIGIQKVLLSISGMWVFSLALTIAALSWSSFKLKQVQPSAWLSKLLVVLIVFRFAIPMVTLGTDFLSDRFLAADAIASQELIEKAFGHLENPKGSLVIRDVKDRLQAMKTLTSSATEHLIKLMVISLLQTVVIPIFMILALYVFLKSSFSLPQRKSPI